MRWFAAILAPAVLLVSGFMPGTPVHANDGKPRIAVLEVRETAGIRRRNDVVSARLVFDKPIAAAANFCLTHDGHPIVCQFSTERDASNRIRAVWLDFVDHFAPLETRQYELIFDEDVEAVAVPKSGFELRESAGEFRISNRGIIEWTVRKDLAGMFAFRHKPGVDYLQPNSPGLALRTRDGKVYSLADRKAGEVRIVRRGPIACALKFDYADWPTSASGSVTLEFFHTKSWVHVTWTLNDADKVAGMSVELHLALSGKEKLIDFGAGDFVYTTVAADEVAVLDAGGRSDSPRAAPWKVLHGKRDALKPLVVASPKQPPERIGGWVHLMDSTRCTAAAVCEFGVSNHDRIEVDGSGRMLIDRRFSRRPQMHKTLEFWVHFVKMPVHLGARTSPQSMRSPVEVRWMKESSGQGKGP